MVQQGWRAALQTGVLALLGTQPDRIPPPLQSDVATRLGSSL